MRSPAHDLGTIHATSTIHATPVTVVAAPATVLGAAIDTAADALTTERPDALRRADDAIRGALATLAARGALCTVPAAVRALHETEHRLAAHDRGGAGAALAEARQLIAGLPIDVPRQRDLAR